MGVEYALKLKEVRRGRLDALLRSLSQFACFAPEYRSYEFRAERSTDTKRMPDAYIVIEEYGLYFCDNGGEGKRILEHLILKIENEYAEAILDSE